MPPAPPAAPHFFYPIEGGTLEVTRESGVVRATLEAGKVCYRSGGDTHATKNFDEHRYREMLVELKS